MSSTPHDSGSDTENESENSVKNEQWDPEAKPLKGILKKEGSSRKEKKDEHIHLQAEEGKDAEKKRRNTNPVPVEGVKGIVMKGNSGKNQISSNKSENDKTTNEIEDKKSTNDKGDEKTTKEKKPSKEKNKEENCTIS